MEVRVDDEMVICPTRKILTMRSSDGTVLQKEVKYISILVFYSIFSIFYPFVRYRGNWLNNDATNKIPKLTLGAETNSILIGATNSLYHSIMTIMVHEVANIGVPDIYLYYFPISVGLFSVVTLIYFYRETINSKYWVLAAAIITIETLLMELRTQGKSTPFLFIIFFIILTPIMKGEYSQRKAAIILVLLHALIFYHTQISGLLLAILFSLFALTKFISHFPYTESSSLSPLHYVPIIAFIMWIFFYINSPINSFGAFIRRILFGTTRSSSETGAGQNIPTYFENFEIIGRFFARLSSGWEPWWIWFILSFWLFITLLIGGIMWVKKTSHIAFRREKLTRIYILTTITGGFGIMVFLLGISGYSATNIYFRYLKFFYPIAVLFIVVELPWNRLFNTNSLIYILVILVLIGSIVAPIKVSKEQSVTNDHGFSYTDYEKSALLHIYEYNSAQVIVVPPEIKARAIILINDESSISSELPKVIHNEDELQREINYNKLEKSEYSRNLESKIYSNRDTDILYITA